MTEQRLKDLCDAIVVKYLDYAGPGDAPQLLPTLNRRRVAELLSSSAVPSLQSLVVDHLASTSSASLSALSVSGATAQWTPLPLSPSTAPARVTRTLREVHASNILSVVPVSLPQKRFSAASQDLERTLLETICTTSVDRSIRLTAPANWEVVEHIELSIPSPVLSVAQHSKQPRLLIGGLLSGHVIGWDLVERREVFVMKDHTKYVVRVAVSQDGQYLATASYDRTIRIYLLDGVPVSAVADSTLWDGTLSVQPRLLKSIATLHNPEAMLLVPPTSSQPCSWLLYSTRADCFVHGVELPEDASAGAFKETKWNTNANGDEWVSFDIVDLALPHPGTHLSLLLTSINNPSTPPRVLILPLFQSATPSSPIIFTSASTSALVTPRQAWLADGSGVLVSGDDGHINLLAADRAGPAIDIKIGAHGPAAPAEDGEDAVLAEPMGERGKERSKADQGSGVVRDLCVVQGGTVISVGFDRTVRVITT